MKKTLILASGLLLVSQVFAQKVGRVTSQLPEATLKPSVAQAAEGTPATSSFSRASGDTIPIGEGKMYWNFADSIPSGWSVVDIANQGNWAWTDLPPQGSFSTNIPVIASSTSENGFMILDGDFNNPGGTSDVMNAYLQSPVLDLSAYADVMLKFQHFFRYCCSENTISMLIQVSDNGGQSFTDFDFRDGVVVNTTSLNGARKDLNISAVAAGKSNVVIRFKVTGASHYFWMIDDIAITESSTNDIVFNKQYADFFQLEGGYYTRIPQSQADTIAFRAAVKNIGSATQTDVKLNVAIKKGTNEVYNETSEGITIPRLAEDTLEILPALGYQPAAIGTYTVKCNVNQAETDENPSNDTLPSFSFIVNDSVFARENGVVTGRRVSTGSFEGGDVDGSKIVTEYGCLRPGKLLSISVYLDDSTGLGTTFKGIVLDGNLATVIETDLVDIENANQLGKWVTLPLLWDGVAEFVPEGGAIFLVGIEVAAGSSPTKNVFIPIDVSTPQPIRTSFVFPAGLSTPTWFYTTYGQAFIRLNVGDVDVSIQSPEVQGFSLGQNLPNPSTAITTIEYSLEKASSVSLDITDLSGKLIQQLPQGRKSTGKYQVNLNTSQFAAGTYFYTLKTDLGVQTKKMIVTK